MVLQPLLHLFQWSPYIVAALLDLQRFAHLLHEALYPYFGALFDVHRGRAVDSSTCPDLRGLLEALWSESRFRHSGFPALGEVADSVDSVDGSHGTTRYSRWGSDASMALEIYCALQSIARR